MALEGTFHDMPLVDLLQVFSMGPKSGILLLAHMVERGVMYVAEGRVIDALLISAGDQRVLARGDTAVLHVLRWDDARFTFRHDDLASKRPVHVTYNEEWLMQAAAQAASSSAPAADSHTSVVALSPVPPDLHITSLFTIQQWRLLSLAAHGVAIHQLAAHLALPAEQVVGMVAELAQLGAVVVTQPPVPPERVNTPLSMRAVSEPFLQPAASTRQTATLPNRGLLAAVMRRVRGL